MSRHVLRLKTCLLGLFCLFPLGCKSDGKPAIGIPSRAQSPTAAPSTARVEAESVTSIDIRIKLPTPSPPAPSTVPVLTPEPTPTPMPTQTPRPTPKPTPTPEPTPEPITVTEVEIAAPENTSLTTRDSLDLSAVVSLSDDSESDAVTWSSSDPAIASVDAEGHVQTLRAGQVSIIASATTDSEQRDELELTIENPVVEFEGTILYLAEGDLYLMEGSNHEPRRLTFDGEDVYKGYPRLNWDSSLVTYFDSGYYIQTLDTSGSGSPNQLEMPKDRVYPLPYFRHDGNILFVGKGDPGYGSSIRFWNYAPDDTLEIYSTAIFGDRVSYIAGVTPDDVLVYEDGGSVNICPYDDVNQTIYVGSGNNPKIAQNDHPSLIVYDFKNNIRVVDFEGQKRDLTQTSYAEFQAALSPDESQVVFVSERDGNRDLFLMNLDGTGLVNLTNTPDIQEVLPDWGN